MEGLNDGRAVKTIVPQVNPRKMVSADYSHPLSHFSHFHEIDHRTRSC